MSSPPSSEYSRDYLLSICHLLGPKECELRFAGANLFKDGEEVCFKKVTQVLSMQTVPFKQQLDNSLEQWQQNGT